MKKKQLFLAATAILLASCADNSYLGDQAAIGEGAGGVITFESSTPNLTRAAGAEAATMLNNNFVVFGYKTISSGDQTVFDNYEVNFVENSAQKTASNTKDWEYVGYTSKATVPATQSIKYWDLSATSYDFFAYSLGKTTSLATASVITNSTYTLTGTQAQLGACYISKKNHITSLAATSAHLVTLDFMNFLSKVQVKFYEVIPGYAVTGLKFYSSAETTATSSTTPCLFAGSETLPTAGTYTVTFDDSNYPKLTLSATSNVDKLTFDATLTNYAEDKENAEPNNNYLGRTSSKATATNQIGVLPYPAGTELTLKVDYTLVSIDGSGETIEVKGATAKVPANYVQWKPNFAYTYLFKITDDPNGTEGLYPITFDAVVVDNTEGSQQTITTVATPSITTYQKGVVTNDYTVANGDIYVTVEGDAGALLPLQTTDGTTTTTTTVKAALYTFTGNHTEAEIVKALKVRTSDLAATTINGRNGITLTPAKESDNTTDLLKITNSVNGKDFGTDNVGQFTPAAGNYAFVYIKKAPTIPATSETLKTVYEIKSFTTGASVKGFYRYFTFGAQTGDAQSEVKYYTIDGTPVTDLFYGQDATGLYELDGTTYKPATGKVASGTTYYPVPVAAVSPTSTSGLLEASGDNYVPTTDTDVNASKTYYSAPTAVTTNSYEECKTAITNENLYTDENGTNKVTTAPTTEANSATTYYLRSGDTSSYTYTRVYILPEQIDGKYKLANSTTPEACTDTEKAIAGQKYYDKFDQNDGEYAVKVIKVQ